MKVSDSNWQRALRQLPQQLPSDKVWEAIEQELDEQAVNDQSSYETVLADLPEWEPSEKTWSNITTELPKRPGTFWWRSAAAIALICATAASAWWWQGLRETTTLSYSHEDTQVAPMVMNDQPMLDPLVAESLNNEHLLKDRPELASLKIQLQELDAAMAELNNSPFALQDPQIQLQQARIQRLKAEVIKKMVQLLLA
ncbi:MAG: hypothetical protein ACFB10_03175 [Salibacteraceae bacterium]